MKLGDTIKTTVRLPTELHWEFQGERAKRRLSNEKAIGEAFAAWIAAPARAALSARPSPGVPVTRQERKSVEILLQILRDREHPTRAAALSAVLEALSARSWEERANDPRAGISSSAASGSTRRMRLRRNAKDARRGTVGQRGRQTVLTA